MTTANARGETLAVGRCQGHLRTTVHGSGCGRGFVGCRWGRPWELTHGWKLSSRRPFPCLPRYRRLRCWRFTLSCSAPAPRCLVAMVGFSVFFTLAQSVYQAAKKDVSDHSVYKAYSLGASSPEVIYEVLWKQIVPRVIEAIRLADRSCDGVFDCGRVCRGGRCWDGLSDPNSVSGF